jgi:UDP-N-acetylmuramoyl-L-alanyl-D-glutamate--2,6-diaminopimelate ligase
MRLRTLVQRAYPDRPDLAEGLPEVEVAGVTQDSRRVAPGWLFVARRGERVDAHAFLPEVVGAGAVAVAGARADAPREALAGRPYLRVPDDRAAVARLASAFHDWPARRTRVVGVTGTDGKTTTSALTWWTLSTLGPTALASTAATRIGSTARPWPGHFTTPEADDVQAFLAEAVDAGAARVVLESSSHGLALGRLDAIDYALAIWTNLSPEHLDFHGSYDAYREAKATLVRRAAHAVLNRDEPDYPHFAAAATGVTSYGEHRDADWRLLEVRAVPAGSVLRVGAPDGRERTAELPLPGRFNAWNALAAWAAAVREGADADAVARRLGRFPGVAGRMQRVQATPFAVVVDFAHTAPALTKALEAVRPGAARTIVVIGAAGERDPAKRAPLGAAAVRGADLTILTEEDARSEDPDAILARMAEGARAAGGVEGRDFRIVPDRRDAIRAAIAAAGPGDLVLLCGKGHETTLERADATLPWNEVEEARAALTERSGTGHDAALE